MLNKTLAYDVAICDNCEKFIIYKHASQGFPKICPKCGVPSDKTLTTEEMNSIRKAQEEQSRREFVQNHGMNGQTFYVRRG